MKHLGKIITYLILAINALFVGILIVSAYSSWLHPAVHPLASCLGLAFPVFLTVNVIFLVLWLIINYRYALLPLIGLLICFPQIRTYMPLNLNGGTPSDTAIKLLSYNVMSFSKLEKKNGTNPILSYLANSGADIICLQEYNTSNNRKFITDRDVRKALKAYPYRSIRQQGKGEVELACFSKFPILSTHPVNYPSSYNGSMCYVVKVKNDTMTIINNHLESNKSMCYVVKVKNDTMTIINNHLESNKLTIADRGMYENMIKAPNTQKVKTGLKQLVRKLAEASAIRAPQADSVAKLIERSPYPSIIACGDFNDCSISYTHRILTKQLNDAFIRAPQADSVAKLIERSPYPSIIACGDFNDCSISYTHRILTKQLNDAFTQSGNGLGISYNQNKFYFRIDNILISRNLKAYNCTVDRSIKASDHYPIWCYISKR